MNWEIKFSRIGIIHFGECKTQVRKRKHIKDIKRNNDNMSITHFIIDSREKQAHKILMDISGQYENTQVSIKQLEVGDYKIHKEGVAPFIIEKKLVPDLCASITDGRHREQKERLMALARENDVRIAYLIEGDFIRDSPRYGRSHTGGGGPVISSIINTIFRDNIPVIKTTNYQESMLFFKTILKRISRGPEIGVPTGLTAEDVVVESNTMGKTRGSGLTPRVIFRSAISQIPGISLKLSDGIVSTWSNVGALLDDIRNQQEPIHYLREKSREFAGRRMNEGVALKLCTFLGINTTPDLPKNQGSLHIDRPLPPPPPEAYYNRD